LPDTTTEIKAILARTLRELEQVIDNANITSFLRGLGSVLGLDGDSAPATKPISRPQVTAKPQRVTASRASTAGAARVPQATTTTAKARTRAPAKPAPTPRASSSAPRARAGARRDQLLALVAAQPGITLTQAATQFGLKNATSLYAVARRLQDDGLVHKSGVELHPTATAQPK
jgi:hypothetical protein